MILRIFQPTFVLLFCLLEITRSWGTQSEPVNEEKCRSLNFSPPRDIILPPSFSKTLTYNTLSNSRNIYDKNINTTLVLAGVYDEDDEATRVTIQAALSIANQILQESESLYFAKLVLANITDDSKSNVERICHMMSCSLVGIIAPRESSSYRTLNFLASRYGIPYIDTYKRAQVLPMTYSLKMHPDNESTAKAIVYFLTHQLKWATFTLIYDSPENLIQMSPFLSMYESNVRIERIQNEIGTSLREIFSSDSKKFLIHLPYWKINEFLVMAYAFNMTGEQYEFFFTDLDTSYLDLRAFQIDDGPKIYSLSIINKTCDGGSNSENLALLKRYIIDYVKVKKETKIHSLTTHSALVYDSVILLAEGLVKLSRKKPIGPYSINCSDQYPKVWANGLSLLNSMRSIEKKQYQKLTGNVTFNEQGSRTNLDLVFNKLYINGFQEDARWKNKLLRTKVRQQAITNRKKSKKPMLRVVTVINEPFVMSKSQDAYGVYKEDPNSWTGFTMEMLNEIADYCDFNYTVKTVTTSDELIQSLKNNESDIAASSLTITYQRSLSVDFTTPYMSIGGGIIMRKPERQKPHLFSFLSPLSPNVWVYVILAYVLVSMSLFTISRLSNKEWQNPHPCDEDSPELRNPFTLLSSFWFYVGALVNQGTEMAPQAMSSRMLTGIWWFFTLIVISTYTANLAAFLTVENRISPIESVEDLVKQSKIKYGTQGQGSTYAFFVDSNMTLYKKIGEYLKANKDNLVADADTGIKKALNEDYAFILESSFSEYYSKRYCNLTKVGGNLGSKGYGYGLQKNSIWTDKITDAILSMKRNDRLNSLKKKFWDSQDADNTCSESKEAKSLGVEQVGGAFIMLIFGFCLAFIVAVIEFYVKARRNVKGKELLNAMWKEIKFAMRCLTSSKKPKPESSKKKRKTYPQEGESADVLKHLNGGLIPIYMEKNGNTMVLGPSQDLHQNKAPSDHFSFEKRMDRNISESFSESSCCSEGEVENEDTSSSPCKGNTSSSYESHLNNQANFAHEKMNNYIWMTNGNYGFNDDYTHSSPVKAPQKASQNNNTQILYRNNDRNLF